jgi:uncharacterized protein YjbJ (UPF0337 family)
MRKIARSAHRPLPEPSPEPSGKAQGSTANDFQSGRIERDDFRSGENLERKSPECVHAWPCASFGTVDAIYNLQDKEESTMASGKLDEAKGRLKEAAGALTGNKKLKREGKADQVAGEIKQKVGKVVDKVKDATS